NFITFNRHIERCAQFFPVREQLCQGAVFDNSTRQNMSADFGAFFNQADGNFLAGLFGQLFETTGSRQAGRAAADDDYVIFHYITLHIVLLGMSWELLAFGTLSQPYSQAHGTLFCTQMATKTPA